VPRTGNHITRLVRAGALGPTEPIANVIVNKDGEGCLWIGDDATGACFGTLDGKALHSLGATILSLWSPKLKRKRKAAKRATK